MADTQTPQNRYHRQMLLPGIGPAGQQRLAAAHVLLIGCGALGTGIAEQLVRSGIGYLRIADRDLVELTNLQRQVLFDEDDVRQGVPKAIAAANRLRRINSSIAIDPRVIDVHAGNIDELLSIDDRECDLMLDGTDNIETRYLINDVSVKRGVPWVYGACIGTEGRAMVIRPGKTPCLRCLFRQPPGPGELPTCDTAGILGPAAAVVAAIQAASAIRLLSGGADASAGEMIVFDLWASRYHAFSTAAGRREDCPCCAERRFEFLERSPVDRAVTLCGRNAVQIAAPASARIDLTILAQLLASAGRVQQTAYLLRCELAHVPGIRLTIFADGRVIVHGTEDIATARALVAKYVGS